MTVQSLNILVVDDEAPIVELLREYFLARGHDVLTASDAQSALALLAQHPVDAVLSDRRLPGADGLELLRQVRIRREGVAFLFITAFGTIDSAVEAMKLGADDYILKPFVLREVYAATMRAVERCREANQTVRLKGIGRILAATRDVGASELPQLYRRVCRAVTEEYRARGALIAFFEPAANRWMEQHRTSTPAFANLDLDRLANDVREGAPDPDPTRYWFGPSNGTLVAAPLRIGVQEDGPLETVGLLAMVDPSDAGRGTAQGLEVFATLVADALTIALMRKRLRGTAAESTRGLGSRPSPDELRGRVSRAVAKPMSLLGFTERDHLTLAQALMVWASGRPLRELLDNPASLGPDTDTARYVADVALGISERHAGHGSPRGRSGRDIPTIASLLAVAITHDLAAGGSAWQEPMTRDQIRTELQAEAGHRFNPEVVSAYVASMARHELANYTILPLDDEEEDDSGSGWLD